MYLWKQVGQRGQSAAQNFLGLAGKITLSPVSLELFFLPKRSKSFALKLVPSLQPGKMFSKKWLALSDILGLYVTKFLVHFAFQVAMDILQNAVLALCNF